MGIHTLVTTKFKTTALVLNIQRPLDEAHVTRTALLPGVLERGSRTYPSVRHIQRELDSLYGAYLSADVYKVGERHIMQVRLEFPNGSFLPGSPDVLGTAIAFLHDVVTQPLMENGTLKPQFVELEKTCLENRVEGLFNSKGSYAMVRCLQTMCAQEAYRLYSGGRIEDLASITPAELTAAYDEMLRSAPMDLFVVGDVDPAAVSREVKARFSLPERSVKPLPPTAIVTAVGEEKHQVERFDVNQGQLILGLRSPITYQSDDYYAMLMYNGILGGFAHSKMFMHVREKESLAYTARSRYDAQKGLVFIQAGINNEHYEKALRVIREQLAAMEAGEITDQELDQTRAMIVNNYKEAYDSPGALINLAFESLVAGRERSIEELTAAVPTIGKDDVVRMARQVKLDTVYFLRDTARGQKEEQVGAHA
jgi:predicted Zn-dependent peptidase